MPINDEKRHEIAEVLRELAMHPEIDGDVNMYDLIDALRMELGRYSGFVTPEAVERLADLIDRPTCRMVEFVRAEWRDEDGVRRIVECRCSNCGSGPWADPESVTAHCPNCGAKVVMGERGETR